MNFHYNFRKTEYKKNRKEHAFYILSTCYQSHREMMDTVRSAVPYMLFRNITNQCSAFLCSTKIFDKLAANLKSAAANKLLKGHDFEHRRGQSSHYLLLKFTPGWLQRHCSFQLNPPPVTTLKVLTNEKRGGLKVATFDRSPFKLCSLKFSAKSVQAGPILWEA